MKVIKKLAVVVALGSLVACDQVEKSADQEVALDTQQKKISYIIGRDVAVQWANAGVPLDPDAVAQAIRDSLNNKMDRLSEKDITDAVAQFQKDMEQRQAEMQKSHAEATAKAEAEFEKMAESNLKEGEDFLAENANKEGVVTTESGLQYKVLEEGTGIKPAPTDRVKVNYRGTLLDGTEFDSSYKRGVPAEFGVSQVIAGWVEGLQLMNEGAKYELYIPGNLAYGPGGTGDVIGPNATLVFEVELLKVIKPEQATTEEAAAE